MAKTVNIRYDGVDYTLEYTRKSVETMEKQGFVVSDVATKPVSTLPVLFAGAFLAHHRFVKKETVDAIFDKIPNKSEFLQKLSEMYSEPIEALMEEPEESEGNVSWEANW